MEEKRLPISDDMAEYFDAYHAAILIRDKALEMPFGYKKAYKAARDAVKNQKKFWKMVFKVYPEVSGEPYQYYRLEQVLVKTQEDPSTDII